MADFVLSSERGVTSWNRPDAATDTGVAPDGP
jgi:hypothetical protein